MIELDFFQLLFLIFGSLFVLGSIGWAIGCLVILRIRK